MPSAAVLKVKQAYNDKICKLLDDNDRAFLVHADNVGSRQFMDIRAVRTPWARSMERKRLLFVALPLLVTNTQQPKSPV